MKKTALIALLISFLSIIGVSQTEITPVEYHGHIQVEGNQILGQHGEPAQLRGMSFFWSQWKGGFYNSNVVDWMSTDWKCSVLRAAMAVDEDVDGYLSDSLGEIRKVETVVEAAIDNGIYVIIDWHTHYAEYYTEEAKAFFDYMSKKYGAYDNVIYEVYNEPINSNWSTVIKPYTEEVIAAIRANDPDNLILAGNRRWSSRPDEAVSDPIEDTNVAYVMHYYAGTHGDGYRQNMIDALEGGLPVFVSEFGISEADGNGEIDLANAKVWWSLLDEYNVSWCNWSISDKDEAASSLLPGASTNAGWSLDKLSESGNIIRSRLRGDYYAFSTDDRFSLVLDNESVFLLPDSSEQLVFSLYDSLGNKIDTVLSVTFVIEGADVDSNNVITAGSESGVFWFNAIVEYNGGTYATKANFGISTIGIEDRDAGAINSMLALTKDTSYYLDGKFYYPSPLAELLVEEGGSILFSSETHVWKSVTDEDGVWADSVADSEAYFALHLISPFQQSAQIKYSTGGNLNVYVNGVRVVPNDADVVDAKSDVFSLYPNENTIVISYKNSDNLKGFTFSFVDESGNDLEFKSFSSATSLTQVENLDCNNEWRGTAYLDSCNICVGGSTLRSECGVQLPFLDEAFEIPLGRIDAEDFDFGGEGISYHDSDDENSGGKYRGEPVDIESIDGSTTRFNVGWTVAGEWLEYTVDVQETRYYYLRMNAATNMTNGADYHIELDGKNVSGTIHIDNTGGWQDFEVVASDPIFMDAGEQVLRLVFETDGLNVDYFFTLEAPDIDCNGDTEGAAYRNNCGVCVEGNSGVTFEEAAEDCVNGLEESFQYVVYPNPSSSGFVIETDQVVTYEFFDCTGLRVSQGTTASSEMVGEDLKEGLYVLRIYSGDVVRQLKVIKE